MINIGMSKGVVPQYLCFSGSSHHPYHINWIHSDAVLPQSALSGLSRVLPSTNTAFDICDWITTLELEEETTGFKDCPFWIAKHAVKGILYWSKQQEVSLVLTFQILDHSL